MFVQQQTFSEKGVGGCVFHPGRLILSSDVTELVNLSVFPVWSGMFNTSVCVGCLAGFVWVLRQKTVHVCRYGENLASGRFLVGLAEFLFSHYLSELSLGVLILISRVTGAQSKHVFIYSNMKHKFAMVNSLTSELQLWVWQMRMLKPPKAEGVGARNRKTRTPWNLWQKLPRRTKQTQKLDTCAADTFWNTL